MKQPAGCSDLIKEQSSKVGFNEALKAAHNMHADPLSAVSVASGGFVSLADKHPSPCRLLPTSVLRSLLTERPDCEQQGYVRSDVKENTIRLPYTVEQHPLYQMAFNACGNVL